MSEADTTTTADVLPIVEACEIMGGQAVMARCLGVTPAAVNQWCKGLRVVPAERCPTIQRLTGGRVTCKALRRDVDWDGAGIVPDPDAPGIERRHGERREPAPEGQG